jgi:hypothetical protein
VAVAILTSPFVARSDLLFVGNRNGPGLSPIGTIGEYTTSGATVNASLLSGLYYPDQIAISGSDMFVVQDSNGTVGEYTTSGATVNASLITGLTNPIGIAVSGSNLFVSSDNNNTAGAGKIGEYTTSGATVNASLITGLFSPANLAVSGSNLFVAEVNIAGGYEVGEYNTSGSTVNASLITIPGFEQVTAVVVSGSVLFISYGRIVPGQNGIAHIGTIAEYTTSGATVNAALISDSNVPLGIAVSGSDLFVVDNLTGTLAEYTTSGSVVNASLITGLTDPYDVALVPVPEPSAGALLAAGIVSFAVRQRTVRYLGKQ